MKGRRKQTQKEKSTEVRKIYEQKGETGENETFPSRKMRHENRERMCKTYCEGKRSLSKGRGTKATTELKLDWSFKNLTSKKAPFLVTFYAVSPGTFLKRGVHTLSDLRKAQENANEETNM